MSTDPPPDSGPPEKSRAPKATTGRQPLEVDFQDLSGGLDVVSIRCGDEVYQLRRTRAGRLLLNK